MIVVVLQNDCVAARCVDRGNLWQKLCLRAEVDGFCFLAE